MLSCEFFKVFRNTYFEEHMRTAAFEQSFLPNCENDLYLEGVHLTLPPHIYSVQVNPGACYITGHIQNRIKEI